MKLDQLPKPAATPRPADTAGPSGNAGPRPPRTTPKPPLARPDSDAATGAREVTKSRVRPLQVNGRDIPLRLPPSVPRPDPGRYDPSSGRPPRPGEIIAVGIDPNGPNGGVIRVPFPPLHGPEGTALHPNGRPPKPGDVIAIGINPNTPNGGVIRVPYPEAPEPTGGPTPGGGLGAVLDGIF